MGGPTSLVSLACSAPQYRSRMRTVIAIDLRMRWQSECQDADNATRTSGTLDPYKFFAISHCSFHEYSQFLYTSEHVTPWSPCGSLFLQNLSRFQIPAFPDVHYVHFRGGSITFNFQTHCRLVLDFAQPCHHPRFDYSAKPTHFLSTKSQPFRICQPRFYCSLWHYRAVHCYQTWGASSDNKGW